MSGRINARSTPPPSGYKALVWASRFAEPPGIADEGILQMFRSSGLLLGTSASQQPTLAHAENIEFKTPVFQQFTNAFHLSVMIGTN